MDALVLASVIGPPVGIVLVLSLVLKIVLGSAKKTQPIPRPPVPNPTKRKKAVTTAATIAPDDSKTEKVSVPISARIKKVLPSGLTTAVTGGQAQVSEAEAADLARRDALAELVAAEHRRGMAADGGTGSLPQMVPVPAQVSAEPMKESAHAGAWLDRPIRVSPEQAAVPHLVKAAEDDQIDFIDPEGEFTAEVDVAQSSSVSDVADVAAAAVKPVSVAVPAPGGAEVATAGASVPQVSEPVVEHVSAPESVTGEEPGDAGNLELPQEVASEVKPARVPTQPPAALVDLAAAHQQQLQVVAAARAESFQVLADLAAAPVHLSVNWAVVGSVMPQIGDGPWTNPALVRIDPVVADDSSPMTGGHDVIVTSAAQANPVRSAAGTSDYEQIIDHLHNLAAELSQVLTQVRSNNVESVSAAPVEPVVEEYLAEFDPELSFDPPLPSLGGSSESLETTFDPPLPASATELSEDFSQSCLGDSSGESELVTEAATENTAPVIPVVRMAAPIGSENGPARHAKPAPEPHSPAVPLIPLVAEANVPTQPVDSEQDPLVRHLASANGAQDAAAVIDLRQSLVAATGGTELAFAPAPFVSLGALAGAADCSVGVENATRITRRQQGRALAGQAVTHRIVQPEVTRWQNIVPVRSDNPQSGSDYSVSSRREGRVGFARQAERKAFEDSLERRKQLLFDGTDLAFESGYDECLN